MIELGKTFGDLSAQQALDEAATTRWTRGDGQAVASREVGTKRRVMRRGPCEMAEGARWRLIF